MAYGARHASDGVEGRLVSMHTFDAPWTSWEVHPKREAVSNPPRVWHTADVDAPCTALFVTAGLGTENRPR